MTSAILEPSSLGSSNTISQPASQVVGNASTNEKFKFSPTGQELALTTHDGRMTVWDAQTRQIKHQYIPSKHLSAVCTCLSWMPLKEHSSTPNKSRKRKTSTSSLTNGIDGSPNQHGKSNGKVTGSSDNRRSDTIALGTSSGSILIYSLKTGDVTSQYSKESAHNGRVNDIVWNIEGTEIFSCSVDGFICQIDIKTSKLLSKFHTNCSDKAGQVSTVSRSGTGRGREPLYSICLHPNERSVIVGSLSRLTWMDLDTKSALKTFEGGHVGVVTSLTILQMYKQCYVLSAGDSSEDYTITAWKLSLDEDIDLKDKGKLKKQGLQQSSDSIIAKFSANESVRSVFVPSFYEDKSTNNSVRSEENNEQLIGAITKSGTLHCFKHEFSPTRRKKPIKPKSSIQLATEKDSNGHTNSIPILDAKFDIPHDKSSTMVQISYGNHIRPVFESIEYESLDKHTCLVRPSHLILPNKQAAGGEIQATSNLVIPDTSNVRVLGPASATTADKNGAALKRKASTSNKGESLAMVDRLRLLSRDADQKTTPPRTDSMVQLLLQGLHNKDRKILDSVLDRADEDLIENTVKKLPVEFVIPLIRELQHYIKGRGMVNQAHSKWLKYAIQIHTGHLMSTPNCEELLGPVYSLIEARTRHYSMALQLKGKLDMMTRQITAKPDSTEKDEVSNREALLVYQDDSSDELSEVMDDLLLPASDTDDNWFQEDDEDDEDDSDDESENDAEENNENNDLELEDNSSENEEVSLVNGKFKMNGDENMDSD